ncbi:hypothetical protein AB0N07_24775 [Streptomyces sp. NPDC051172]|uniref:hypothetical protein n=1 Tax=Streptomyces sp. NPDC051172 TaxID=3155796 RepID=UPI00341E097E
MTPLLVAAFLIVHGLLHPGVWTAPQQPGTAAPFTPGHSWVPAAVGVRPGAGWWPTAGLVAASSGLVLKAVWFDPWLSVGVLLDVGVITAVASSWPASVC